MAIDRISPANAPHNWSSISTRLSVIVFKGRASQAVAKELANRIPQIQLIDQTKTGDFGLDRQRALFIFDGKTGTGRSGKPKLFVNQGIKNGTEYPYSIRVSDLVDPGNPITIKKIANQVAADYFRDLEKNIIDHGSPWGTTGAKTKGAFNTAAQDLQIIRDFALFLKLNNASAPTTDGCWDAAQNWLLEGISGERPLDVFAMVCPDYGKEEERYTFDNRLGSSIGLVAAKAHEYIQKMHGFASWHGLAMRFLIGIADYEATEENLTRLGESRESFFKKIDASLALSRDKLDALGILNLCFHIERYFDSIKPGTWKAESFASEALIRRSIEDLPKNKVRMLLAQRRKLYERWFGNISDNEIKENIIRHAIEYATCGKLLERNFGNVLVLGATSINVEYFYRLASGIPVINLASVY